MSSKNTTLFISDLHLDEAHPEITRTFFYFLEHIAIDADALYILGDFFELYIGADDTDPFKESILRALSRARDIGLPIFVMRGNRDFLLGKKFEMQTGVTLIPDPTVITLYGQNVLLMHGDSLCTRDNAHQRFRKIVNNRLIQKILLSFPLSFRRKIGTGLRQESKKQNATKSYEIMDVSDETVEQEMDRFHVKRLIHGHTHKPAIHKLPKDKERIVMNAWHHHGNYLRVDRDGKTELIDIDMSLSSTDYFIIP